MAIFDSQPEGSEILISCECCKELAASHRKGPVYSHDKSRNVKNLAILF